MAAARTSQNGHAKRVIDMDRARIARAEVAGAPVLVKLGGQQFTMPAELPIAFAEAGARGEMREALEILFGEQAEAFFKNGPTVEDVKFLMDTAAGFYGVDVGESSASVSS